MNILGDLSGLKRFHFEIGMEKNTVAAAGLAMKLYCACEVQVCRGPWNEIADLILARSTASSRPRKFGDNLQECLRCFGLIPVAMM